MEINSKIYAQWDEVQGVKPKRCIFTRKNMEIIYFDFSYYKYWQNWHISVSETEHFDFNKNIILDGKLSQ